SPPRNSAQPPQFGAATFAGCGLGVWPASGSGAALASGIATDCPPSNNPPANNETSAAFNGLRRDMAVIVTAPNTRGDAKRSRLDFDAGRPGRLTLGAAGRRGAADQIRRHVVVNAAVALEDDRVLGPVEGEQRAV